MKKLEKENKSSRPINASSLRALNLLHFILQQLKPIDLSEILEKNSIKQFLVQRVTVDKTVAEYRLAMSNISDIFNDI